MDQLKQFEIDVKSKFPVENGFVVGDVYCKYFFFDYSRPLVIAFANAASLTSNNNLNNENYSPWGFNFLKGLDCNVLAFSCIEDASWYRGHKLHEFIQGISNFLLPFSLRLGYGGSMGGFAVGAFASVLRVDRVLLITPITTLSVSIVPSESGHGKSRSLNWSGAYSDGAEFNAGGYVVYDNLLRRDALHASRYRNLKHLRVPGLGHGLAPWLQAMGMLRKLVNDFISDSVDELWFRKCARNRRLLPRYYNELLLRKDLLSPGKVAVLKRYRRAALAYQGEDTFGDDFIAALREAAVKIESENLELSYKLLAGASVLRPEGPWIKKKLKEYEEKLTII
ncbi:hypothetical protein ACJJIQ_22935 [Microbulbifer sp. ANSA003]|uniref:hypothetical protein n=1 Tax=Microbulbifer sp. ANSA003 TaxID=3243360 RepID=UPI00404317F4